VATILSPLDIYHLAIQAGWSASDAVTATAIAMAESGGNADVTNSIGATGIWQIYDGSYPSSSRAAQLRDPVENAKEAYAKWKASQGTSCGGWWPWASYNEGPCAARHEAGRNNSWRQFLAPAQSAGQGVDGSGGAVTTVDPVLAGGAALVSAQSSSAGTLDASPILGSQALGTLVGRVASPGFWWAAGFFVLAGVLILVGLLVVFHQQVEQAATQVGKVAAVAA
jgi:hypothetical protein